MALAQKRKHILSCLKAWIKQHQRKTSRVVEPTAGEIGSVPQVDVKNHHPEKRGVSCSRCPLKTSDLACHRVPSPL